MREISVEEKAKRYDEVIERAKKMFSDKEIDYLFPELKENGDERIRKDIIEYFKHYSGGDNVSIKIPEWIAWLEKQGKLVEYYEDRLDRCACENFNKGYKAALEAAKEEKVNNANKAEPKFKVGDWVVNTITKEVEQVIELTNDEYICSGHLVVSFNNQHLLRGWTIQDAKDGDVLAFKNNICGIIICKSPTDYDTGSYCRFVNDNLINKEESGWDSTLLVPATKEQRDTLIKAMADAGYRWDAERKELEKVEHNVQLTEFEDAIKDMMNDYRDAIGDNDATIEEIKKHAAYLLSLIHQKPAWSEEDEKIKCSLVYLIEEIIRQPLKRLENWKGCITWLESLKDRYV